VTDQPIQSPPAPRLPDDYTTPRSIEELLQEFVRAGANANRVEVDAKLAVMLASELNRATHALTNNLIELGTKIGGLTKQIDAGSQAATTEIGKLTTSLSNGAEALNATVDTGNRLSRRVGWLNFLVVLLMLVQIWLGWKALPAH